jgi:uncharacterized protein YjiS (DUF1127 family)
MSGYTSAPPPFPTIRRSTGLSMRLWAQALWARIVRMRRVAETRRELGTLNPRLLADIGLTRAEAAAEAERWPWDLDTSRTPGRGTGAHW